MIALIQAHRAGLFTQAHWLPNLISGLVVGVVALPLAMAFAIASGAKPADGIYTAIIAGAIVSIFGGTKLQIAGPTGAFIAILAGITAKYGVAGLQVATLLAGVILLLLGLAKLGGVMKFVPQPVIIGFTTGIGVIIFVGQWQAFLGLPKPVGEHFHQKLWHLFQMLPDTHLPTLTLASVSLAILLITPKIKYISKIPAPLWALMFANMIYLYLKQTPYGVGIATIGTAFGGIPQGLPSFKLPDLPIAQWVNLIGPAFAIAMLGAIESLLCAVVADSMAGTTHEPNQELIGQGLANIIVPLFGGFAATGALARTATNVRNGATSPLSGIMHAVTLLAILLFLAPLASDIPLACLAAILFVVAWNMSELKHFTHIAQFAPKSDRALLIITFALTVLVDLVVAVNVGVILAMLLFIKEISKSSNTTSAHHDSIKDELQSYGIDALPKTTLVFDIDGPVFFGAVEHLQQALLHTHTDPKHLIIRMRYVPMVDFTGLSALQRVTETLNKRDVTVILCEAKPEVYQYILQQGMVNKYTLLVPSFKQALEQT